MEVPELAQSPLACRPVIGKFTVHAHPPRRVIVQGDHKWEYERVFCNTAVASGIRARDGLDRLCSHVLPTFSEASSGEDVWCCTLQYDCRARFSRREGKCDVRGMRAMRICACRDQRWAAGDMTSSLRSKDGHAPSDGLRSGLWQHAFEASYPEKRSLRSAPARPVACLLIPLTEQPVFSLLLTSVGGSHQAPGSADRCSHFAYLCRSRGRRQQAKVSNTPQRRR